MDEPRPQPADEPNDDWRPEDIGHPRGTLVIVILYGLLFTFMWLGLYLFEFLPRGGPQP